MPRYYPNTRFSDCWASVGNVTFFHQDGKCYFRKKAECNFPGTPGQLENAEIHHRAIIAWQSLDHNVQLEWRQLALSVPAHRPPFDNKNHISGYNLFVSAYHGFAQLGNEHIPSPTPFPDFPPFSLKVASTQTSGDALIVNCDVYGAPTRYQIIGKIMLAEAGHGCRTGKLRNFAAKEADSGLSSSRVVTFLIPDFKALYGLDLSEYQLHIRYILIDTRTGYRNNYNKFSVRISV